METNPLKILAIDDNADNLLALRAVVQDTLPHATVMAAVSGPQGIALALAEDPDVILLEIVMPEMDGYETCRRLKADERTHHIPVIFLTAQGTDRESRIRALEMGAEAFLSKPLDEVELGAQIRAMAKIKAANVQARQEQARLTGQAAERAAALERELAAQTSMVSALRESRSILDQILNTIPQAIFWKDKEGRYLGCNKVFAATVGFDDPAQVIGKTDYEFPFISDDVATYQADDLGVMESNRPKLHIIEPLELADGTCRWIDTSKMPLTDTAGNTVAVLGIFDDITERRKAEQVLDKFFDQPLNLHLMAHLDGVILRVNQSWENQLGYAREELNGTSFLDLVHPDDRAATLSEISQLGQGITTFAFTNRYRHKNGEYRLLVWSAMASVEDQMIYAVAADITEQERVKQKLADERGHLAGVIQGAHVGTWEWNVQTGATTFNERWAEIVGYTLDELAPVSIETWQKLAHPDDLAESTELLRQHFAGELPYYDFQCRMRHKSGNWIWVRDRGQVVSWSADGQPLMMFGTHADITRRKQVEISLQKSHEMLAMITEQVPGVVYQYRLYPDGRSCFPYSSPGMMEIYEYTPEEVSEDATPVFGRIHPDDLEYVSAAIFESARTQELFHVEFRVILPRQGLRWRLSDAKPDRLADGSTLWYGIITDITERKQAEDEIRNSENRFHALIKNGRDNISLLAADGTLLWESPSINSTLGYAPDQFVGHNIFELMHPDDYAWICNLYAQVVQSPGTTQEGEFRLLHADDSWRWIECSATNLLHEPKVHAIVLNYRDITKRKQAEAALTESEERFRILADDLPALVCEYLRDTTLTYVNSSYADYFGISPGELIGQSFLNLLPETARETSRTAHFSLTPEEPMKIYTNPVVVRGDIRWQEWRDRAIFDEQGNAVRYQAIGLDVTERYRSEALVRMRLELFEFSADHSVEEVLVKTLDLVGELTASPVGFFHSVEDDEETLHLQAWSTKTSQEYCKAEGKGMHYPLSQAGIWADCVRERRVMVHNDYAAVLNRRGLPEGHAALVREVVVPIFRGGKVVAILGIGNKAVDYTDTDTESIIYFADVAWEIANHKRAEIALRESEATLRKAQAIANLGSWVWYMQTRQLVCSEQIYNILGLAPENFVDNPPIETMAGFVHPEDWGNVEQVYAGFLDRGEPISLECRIIRPDGAIRLVRIETGDLVMDQNGLPAMLRGVVQDITERKQAEIALRESEEAHRQLVQNLYAGVIVHAPDTRIVLANEQAHKLLGLTTEQMLGRAATDPIWHFIREDGTRLPIDEYPVMQVLATQAPIQNLQIGMYYPQTGDTGWVLVNAFPEFETDGRLRQIVVTFVDVTERIHAEQERERLLAQVQSQAQQIARIMDTVPEGVVLLSAEGQVLLANPTGQRDLNALSGAAVGDFITHLGSFPLAELVTLSTNKMWQEVTAGQLIFEMIARPVAPLSINPGDPAVDHWVLVINDVTQARHIRDQLEQQERLAAVGQLAAGIAHDFNNILAVIALQAPMLARIANLSERDSERLDVIREQTTHGARLIQQILDFSRRSVLQRQPIDLGPFLKEQVKLLARTLPEAIKVTLECKPGEYVVLADPTRLQQMVMNLAVNARDAMPGGGDLHFALTRQTSSPRSDLSTGSWVQLDVTDSGTGLAAEAQAHLFEPFFTTKPVGQGTGLGLAQVHGIVKQHNGEIDVHSIIGQGTTFTIWLPAVAEDTSVSNPEPEPQVEGRGQTILIVEDNPALLDALSDIVEILGYNAVGASNGVEALAVLNTHKGSIDLVLSDLSMPVMNGDALLGAIRERGLTVPVVILSGYPLDSALEGLKRKGLAAWLLKPPNVQKLGQTLAEVLAG